MWIRRRYYLGHVLSNPAHEPREPLPPWQLKRAKGALERAEAKRARKRLRPGGHRA